MPKMQLKLGEISAEIHIQRQGNHLHITRDGQTAELEIIADTPSGLVLEWLQPDGTRERIRALGFAKGDKRQLWVNGRATTYERVRQRAASDAVAGGLSAAIPAVVSQILVAVGDSVAAGDKLILLESMKMVIPIQAPYAGIISAIHCAAGDSVQAGVVLLDVENQA